MKDTSIDLQPSLSRQLYDRFRQIARLAITLPTARLTESERLRLSLRMFRRGPAMVVNTARGLEWHPGAFPDMAAPAIAAELRERQARAQAWGMLAAMFEKLARWCRDSAIQEQATANQQAARVLDAVMDAAERQQPGLDHRTRGRCLLTALLCLRDSRLAKGRRKAPAKKAPPTPRQKRLAEERKQLRRDALHAVVRAHLRGEE